MSVTVIQGIIFIGIVGITLAFANTKIGQKIANTINLF
jgi:hypothetical protein